MINDFNYVKRNYDQNFELNEVAGISMQLNLSVGNIYLAN